MPNIFKSFLKPAVDQYVFKDVDDIIIEPPPPPPEENPPEPLNCTPFVRQYDILNNKWGALLCQKEIQTKDIHQNSRKWL